MNAYELGYALSMEKEGQVVPAIKSFLLKYAPGLAKNVFGLGAKVAPRIAPAARRLKVSVTPIIKPKSIWSRARSAEAGIPAIRAGRGLQAAKWTGAGLAGSGLFAGGMHGYQKLTGTTPAEEAAAAATAGGEAARRQEQLGWDEMMARIKTHQQEQAEAAAKAKEEAAAMAEPGILDRLQTPIDIGQTGLKFNPLYGLLGGAAGLGLGTLMGGREEEEDEEGRPRRRSLLTNPLILALLLGAGGGLLPSMMGGAGKGEAA